MMQYINPNQNPLNSYPKWAIGSVVREMLMEDAEIKALVNNHIYPCIAPEGTPGTFIIYKRDKYSKETVHQGVYAEDCQLSLTVISDKYDEGVQLAELIDKKLSGIHILDKQPEKPIRLNIELIDSTEGWDDYKYYQILMFSIK